MIVLLIKFQIGKLFCLKLVNFTFLKHTEVIFSMQSHGLFVMVSVILRRTVVSSAH